MITIAWTIAGICAALLIACTIMLVKERAQHRAFQADLEAVRMSLDLAEMVGRVGTWTLDPDTQTITWSDEVFIIHERPITLGPPALDHAINYYHPDDHAMVTEQVTRAITHGEDFDFRGRLVTGTGTVKEVLSRGTCDFDRDGKVIRIFGAFIDISID